jgi:SPP1 gp7 family putative phage head morphogenesis protein
MYRKTDKVIAYLSKQYASLFRQVTSFDELNVIDVSHKIFDEAVVLTEREVTRLVKTVYDSKREGGEISSEDALSLVLTLMLAYNPVTKYVYRNEMDRKRSRFAEGVIASDHPREEVALATRLMIATNKQFAEDATFEAALRAYKDDGVERVRWVTAEDDRRCQECRSRHGKVYPIDSVPPKPHRFCRCYIEKEEQDADS